MMSMKRVVLGISGGVDSAVAGLLLKRKGLDVIGLFMKNWDLKDEQGICTTEKDAEDSEWICKYLQIPFYETSFVKEYWNEVFSYLTEEYQNGRTPNPDIYCNKYIKFNSFLKYAQEKFGSDIISTGHYARSSFGDFLERCDDKSGAKLLQSFDSRKDQTYFLSQISQSSLQRTMFPLGHISKDMTRKIAAENGLQRISNKKDSTGICFIGKRKFSSFIQEYIDDNPGNFVDLETNEVIGKHRGFHHWTLGQRIRIGGLSSKYYTVSKDIKRNIIYVAKGTDHPSLFSTSILVSPFHWIHRPPELLLQERELECQFRFQHGYPLVNCTVSSDCSGFEAAEKGSFVVKFPQPMRALTPGQFAAIYYGEECLGSSVIKETGQSLYHRTK
ncbi:UNVERIFIED_CONTAM: hypothetical protein RMT77_001404 [Armadillidium vulgare]